MFLRKIVITIILIFILCTDIYGGEIGYICSWVYDEDNNLSYEMEEVTFENNISQEEKAMFLFDKFFNRCDNNIVNFVPENTKLVDIKLNERHLSIYVSSEIKSYGGGSAWEAALVEGILRTGFAITEVDELTLYIGGQIDFLPEGIMLNNYRKEDFIWNE